MRLVIELPDRRPTPSDYDAIAAAAAEALRVGMRLRTPPKWSIEQSCDVLTTSAAAARVGVHRSHWATLAKRHSVEPARTERIGAGQKTVAYWALDDVERIRLERTKNPPKRGPKT